MDGKTFVRVFGFAQSYGHGWAGALMSDAACEDASAGAFARAARMAIDTSDAAERSADGAFWNQRDVQLCVDYPTQSLAALGAEG